MSFVIKLQQNSSPANKITKSVTNIYSFTGVLKDGSSLQDPVVMVENSGPITDVNYAEISDFGRKYFIKEIKSTYNNMWEISLHSDALSSFATQIRACSGIVSKNEFSWNLYLADNEFRCYQNPHIVQKVFPAGFSYSNFSKVIAILGEKQAV